MHVEAEEYNSINWESATIVRGELISTNPSTHSMDSTGFYVSIGDGEYNLYYVVSNFNYDGDLHFFGSKTSLTMTISAPTLRSGIYYVTNQKCPNGFSMMLPLQYIIITKNIQVKELPNSYLHGNYDKFVRVPYDGSFGLCGHKLIYTTYDVDLASMYAYESFEMENYVFRFCEDTVNFFYEDMIRGDYYDNGPIYITERKNPFYTFRSSPIDNIMDLCVSETFGIIEVDYNSNQPLVALYVVYGYEVFISRPYYKTHSATVLRDCKLNAASGEDITRFRNKIKNGEFGILSAY